MAVTSTIMVITQSDQTFNIPGDWSVAQLVASYSAAIPGLAGFVPTETIATGVDGDVRTVTFSPRTGNKG
jgi:hypothetical protein